LPGFGKFFFEIRVFPVDIAKKANLATLQYDGGYVQRNHQNWVLELHRYGL
jgi:hypothetical protein